MQISDLMGYIVPIIAFLFFFFRKQYEDQKTAQNREEAEVESPVLQHILKELNHKEIEKRSRLIKKAGAPRSHPPSSYTMLPESKKRHSIPVPLKETSLIPEYTTAPKGEPKSLSLIKQLERPVNIALYYEIFGKPKGW
jgi:hypothetical protein